MAIKEKVTYPRYEAFIGHNAMNVEQTSTEGTPQPFFIDLSFLSSLNTSHLTIVESQNLAILDQINSP